MPQESCCDGRTHMPVKCRCSSIYRQMCLRAHRMSVLFGCGEFWMSPLVVSKDFKKHKLLIKLLACVPELYSFGKIYHTWASCRLYHTLHLNHRNGWGTFLNVHIPHREIYRVSIPWANLVTQVFVQVVPYKVEDGTRNRTRRRYTFPQRFSLPDPFQELDWSLGWAWRTPSMVS